MINKLRTVLENIDLAYQLIEKEGKRLEKEEVLTALLDSYGVINHIRRENPARYIGHALRLARKYNIKLQSGTASGNVTAYLDPECFPEGVRFNNWFTNPPPEHVKTNSASIERSTVQEAVCECLIMCLDHGLVSVEVENG